MKKFALKLNKTLTLFLSGEHPFDDPSVIQVRMDRLLAGRQGRRRKMKRRKFDRQVKSPSGRESEEGKGKYQKQMHLHEDVLHHS